MSVFSFKQFDVDDYGCGMKICSDSVTFGAWFLSRYAEARSVLDIGAGSGLLALMAAQCMPEARITAVEIDPGAAAAATRNLRSSRWTARFDVVSDDFNLFTPAAKADIIVSNPPFFTTGLLAPDPQRAAARHGCTLTTRSLFAYARRWLAADGHLGLILPAERLDDAIFEGELEGLKLRRYGHIIPRRGKSPIRALFDFSITDGPIERTDVVMREADGTLTEDYRNLVQPFYIKIS